MQVNPLCTNFSVLENIVIAELVLIENDTCVLMFCLFLVILTAGRHFNQLPVFAQLCGSLKSQRDTCT